LSAATEVPAVSVQVGVVPTAMHAALVSSAVTASHAVLSAATEVVAVSVQVPAVTASHEVLSAATEVVAVSVQVGLAKPTDW